MASKKTYNRFKYTVEDLQNAVDAVRNGLLSANKASQQFKIPKGTLMNKLHGKSEVAIRKMGPATFLSTAEEKKIEEWILKKAMIGFPMHPEEVKDAVQKVMEEAQRDNPFKENRPGKKWLNLFLARHPSISKRNAEIISKARAAVTEEGIRGWFRDLEEYLLEENAIDILSEPDRIFNADETGVQLCPKTGKLLGPKKFRNFYDVAVGKEKESITVLANFSASGKIAPPCIVYPYKRIARDIVSSVPDNFCIGRSDTGWMVGPTFYEYVANCFYPWLLSNNIKLPILFLLDGHKSHINPELADFCREKRILLYCLLPNATHIIQPCDVEIFRPLKNAWRKQMLLFKQKTNKTLTKVLFAPAFSEAFKESCKTQTIQNAFRACGLYPFDVNNVDLSKCMNTRHSEKTPEKNLENNIMFLDILEKEISPLSLEKYRKARDINMELKNDKLFSIWNKYASFNESKGSNINIVQVTKENATQSKNKQDDMNSDDDNLDSDNVGNDIPNYNKNAYNDTNLDKNNHTDGDKNSNDDKNPDNDTNQYGDKKQNDFHVLEEILVISYQDIQAVDRAIVIEVVENISKNTSNMANKAHQENGDHFGSEKETNIKNKIIVLSDNVIKPGSSSSLLKTNLIADEIWKKHLHFPNIEHSAKKRRVGEKAPLAVASPAWKAFLNKKENKKRAAELEKEQIKLNRALKKQQKLDKNTTTHKNKGRLHSSPKIASSDTEEDNNLLDLEHYHYPDDEIKHQFQTSFIVADFVIVRYESAFSPGVIINKEKDSYEVRVMHQSGLQHWKWPEKLDQIWYNKEDIVQKIEPPQLACSRGNTYDVPEIKNYKF